MNIGCHYEIEICFNTVEKQLFEPWTAILGNRRTNVDNNNIAGYFFLILEFYICVNIKLIDVEICITKEVR